MSTSPSSSNMNIPRSPPSGAPGSVSDISSSSPPGRRLRSLIGGRLRTRTNRRRLSTQKEIEKKIGPPWHWELSLSQMKSADDLQNGLRDDLEQFSTTKTRVILSGIGLTPLPSKKNLALAIDMSRGNDLAFLWFLNETFYINQSLLDSRINEYSMNQKLILSTIAHLDMVATLRELDRLLPKPQMKKPPSSKPKKPKLRTKKIIYASPYLEPLPRPKIPVSRVYLPPKPLNSSFSPYEMYKDPTYKSPNEENRWYAIKKRKESDSATQIDREELLKGVWSNLPISTDQRKEQIFDQFLKLTKCEPQKQTRVVYQVDLNNAKTADEFVELAKQYQNQLIVKTIVQDLMKNSLNVKQLRACCKTSGCVMDVMRYLKVLERKMDKLKWDDLHENCFNKNPSQFDYDKIFNGVIFPEMEIGYISSQIEKMCKSSTICMRNLFALEIPLWFDPSYEKKINCGVKNLDEDAGELESDLSTEVNTNKKINGHNLEEVMGALEDALNKMKKNPKFVLASLPRAVHLPILIAFTFKRYRGILSEQNRLNLLKKRDKKIQKIQQKHKIKFKPTTTQQLTIRKTATWDDVGWLKRRTNLALEYYFRHVKIHFLNQTNLIWPALLPYLCTDGLPREIFFTYFPTLERDLFLFRPWQKVDGKKDKPL